MLKKTIPAGLVPRRTLSWRRWRKSRRPEREISPSMLFYTPRIFLCLVAMIPFTTLLLLLFLTVVCSISLAHDDETTTGAGAAAVDAIADCDIRTNDVSTW